MNEQAWISGGCPFKGKRIDSKGNIKYKGHMIVSSYELQFVLTKPRGKDRIEKEQFMFKDIKSYGCHENVLSVRLGGGEGGGGGGGGNQNTTEHNMVYFKLKEAVVVKELMDQVIEMKKRPTPRMPSFDFGGGFYDMSPSGQNSRPLLERNHSIPAMQNNASYHEPSRGQSNDFGGYSRAQLERSLSSLSTASTGSSGSGPPSAGIPGYDNPLYKGSVSEQSVQYAQVETLHTPISPEDPFSPPAPNSPHPAGGGYKKKFPLFKCKSAPKFGYTKVDIEVMEALRELDVRTEEKNKEEEEKSKKKGLKKK